MVHIYGVYDSIQKTEIALLLCSQQLTGVLPLRTIYMSLLTGGSTVSQFLFTSSLPGGQGHGFLGGGGALGVGGFGFGFGFGFGAGGQGFGFGFGAGGFGGPGDGGLGFGGPGDGGFGPGPGDGGLGAGPGDGGLGAGGIGAGGLGPGPGAGGPWWKHLSQQLFRHVIFSLLTAKWIIYTNRTKATHG